MHRTEAPAARSPGASAESDGADTFVEQAYARLRTCADDAARIAATAELILVIYDDFYAQLCEYPYRA
jgi:hypothetical protein